MEAAPPTCSWCSMKVCEATSTREKDLRIPASVMKVLFCHKSLYVVHVCVCVCVMEPRSGNLVESGASRLSPCRMQQILFQYQAWVIWKHSQSTYISSGTSSFVFNQFKMQSELIQGLRSHIYSLLDDIFHASNCL